MANITITVPDNQVDRVLDAIATRFKYNGTGTKAAFAKAVLINFIIKTVKAVEGQACATAAIQTANAAVDSQVTLS